MSNYKTKVLKIVEYIELNIKKRICLEVLSSEFNISKFHMSRTFKHLTGDSIASYIRRRKLALSLDYLQKHEYKIIDIALIFGFEYEQSYIRAFKAEFLITPYQYKKIKPILKITHKLTLSDLMLFEDGVLLPPEKVYLPKLQLIGKDYIIDSNDPNYLTNPNKVGVQFLTQESKKITGKVSKAIYYSIVKVLDLKRGFYSYMPSLEYVGKITYPEDMEINHFPPSEYIYFKYIGDHSPYVIDMIRLKKIHTYIKDKFTSYISEKCIPDMKIERIVDDKCSDSYCEMDFFYPIKAGY